MYFWTIILFWGCFKGLEGTGNYTPIVLWHGMGDACCFPFSLGAVQKKLNTSLPGVYIVSLRIGNSIVNDLENSYFLHPDKQITEACNIVNSDPKLHAGFNAIGFSQGAQFMRALVQRCPTATVKNLISIGGQHQGVYGVPNCGSLSSRLCDYIRKLLNYAAYVSWVQQFLVQATYWHDPLNEDEYKNGSTFLSDINNELQMNTQYVDNLQRLENFVMIKFLNDTIVQPIATEWFGFYKSGQSVQVESLEESKLYKEDRLGLRKLNKNSKLHFIEVEGNHLQFEWEWFEKNVIVKYLK